MLETAPLPRRAHHLTGRRRLAPVLPRLRGGAARCVGRAARRGGRAPPPAPLGAATRRRADHRGHPPVRRALRLRALRGSDRRAAVPGRGRFSASRLPPVRRRWEGVYAQCIDGGVCLRQEIAAGCLAGHRSWWSRDDLRPGDRGGHAHGGRGVVMIGPFALACLDMAGTTVRDDGAVDAAFTAALADRRHQRRERPLRRGRSCSCATPWAGRRPTCSPRCSSPTQAATATAAFARSLRVSRRGGRGGRDPRRARRLAGAAGPRGGRVSDDRVRTIDKGRVARRPRLA